MQTLLLPLVVIIVVIYFESIGKIVQEI